MGAYINIKTYLFDILILNHYAEYLNKIFAQNNTYCYHHHNKILKDHFIMFGITSDDQTNIIKI